MIVSQTPFEYTYKPTSTSSSSLSPGGVGWYWRNIFDPSDSHTGSGQCSESRLTSWSWGLGSGTSGSSDLDVECGDSDLLAPDGDVLSGQHGGVRGRLVSVGLDFHATSDSDNCLTTGKIGDVDEGIVERGEDVGDSENTTMNERLVKFEMAVSTYSSPSLI